MEAGQNGMTLIVEYTDGKIVEYIDVSSYTYDGVGVSTLTIYFDDGKSIIIPMCNIRRFGRS